MMINRVLICYLSWVLLAVGFPMVALAEDVDIAGTFYGEPIPKPNYNFALKVVLLFKSPWGQVPKNRQELERRVWDELLMSYEANRRQITASKNEIDRKISETLKAHQVSFEWKTEPDAYAQWTEDTLGESVEIFENQMLHLVQLKKLHQQVRESLNPSVTEDEAFHEFLVEHTNLSVELVEFDTLKEAQEFYEKLIIDPEVWVEASRKDRTYANEDRAFRRPGFVALEFLTQIWKFPEKAAFDMIAKQPGEFYPPAPIHQGYGVFKILEINRADESLYPDRKDYFINQIKSKKRFQGFKDWLAKLRDEADVQVYVDPPYGIFR